MRLSTANASRWRGQPGHYEAWHLRLGDPHSAASAWIRHSFHVPPEAAPGESTAELWFVGRAPDGAAYARRQSFCDRPVPDRRRRLPADARPQLAGRGQRQRPRR